MGQVVSKSSFKDHALEYLREVESTGEELIITDHGKPVLRLIRYAQNPEATLESLRGSVVRYEDPTEPVGEQVGPRKDGNITALPGQGPGLP